MTRIHPKHLRQIPHVPRVGGEPPKESAQRAAHNSNTERLADLSITTTPALAPNIDDDEMDTEENSPEMEHTSLDHALNQKLALNRIPRKMYRGWTDADWS